MAETNKPTRSTLGTTTAQSLDPNIKIYLDAKAASSNMRSNWDVLTDFSSAALSGVEGARETIRLNEETRAKELESYENEFSSNVNTITENAGGLGEEYFGLATGEAKKMQEEYMRAVQSGDKETQQKLKMRLTGLSTSVQSLKESLNIAAELKNGELLSNGRTAKEKEISAVCTNPANVVYEEGEWKWKNPKYDGTEESKEFFTQEDLSKSLGEKDEVTKQLYNKWENEKNGQGSNYVNGVEGAASFDKNRIKTSISDQFITQDNIMSVMHDDFRGSGESHTFVADLRGYLDGMPNMYETFGIDVDGDGIDGNSSEDRKAIIQAITNKEDSNYDFNASKNIVAEYLTMQAEQKFYGEHKKSLKERKALRPDPAETKKQFIARGGIMGELGDENITWNSELNKFEENSSLADQALVDQINAKK